MYEQTRLTGRSRDEWIWNLRRRHFSYVKIAKAVGVSVGSVRASLARTAAELQARAGSEADDWDADLR
jgi:hypothetical protein